MIGRPGALALLCILALPGCEERRLTQNDCTSVRDKVQRAFEHDALAAQRAVDNDQFLRYIREERDRLGADWMKICEPQVGRKVSEAELACLSKAETIDDVYECAL